MKNFAAKYGFMEHAIRLAIIEDIEDVRINIAKLFHNDPEITCVFSADSMESFLDNTDSMVRPDVALVDIGLPGMNGIDGMREIRKIFPETEIIMLTIFNNSDRIFKALCAGASGYLLKNTPLPEVRKAILEVHSGGSYMSPSIARKVVDYFAAPKVKVDDDAVFSLRERQVMQAITDGLSYKMIADRYAITVHTVRFHIRNIYRKLHVNSKSEAVSKLLGRKF